MPNTTIEKQKGTLFSIESFMLAAREESKLWTGHYF